MKYEDLKKVEEIRRQIVELEDFLRTKTGIGKKLYISKIETRYILEIPAGILTPSREIKADSHLSALITDVIEWRIKFLKGELEDLGVEVEHDPKR